MTLILSRYRCSVAFALTATLLLPVAAQAALLGIDVSTHQGTVNWTSVKNGGVAFGFAKATEGVNFIDNKFTTNMTNARNAGVPIGPYHFGRPDSAVGTLADPVKQDAINEANDFVDAIEPYYNSYPGEYLRPVLDIERLPATAEINTISEKRQYLSDWVRDFNGVVQSRLGMDVIIYANSNYANTYFESDLSSLDLWIARWTYNTNNQPTQANLGIWNDWAFWQWSDNWSVGGLSPVDANYFDGDLSDLEAYIAGGEAPLVGDYNDDGTVNAADYTLWRDTFSRFNTDLTADGNGNGAIDTGDYALWVSHFGETNLATSTSVPEPTALLLLSLGGVAAATLRR